MIIEEPDAGPDKLIAELSWMMVRYFTRFKLNAAREGFHCVIFR